MTRTGYIGPLTATLLAAAVGLVAALVMVLGLGTLPAQAQQTTPVTRTFSNPTPIEISSEGSSALGTPYPSNIEATGFDPGCTITDVNATLRNFTHDYPYELKILLVGPHDQNVVLTSMAGARASNVTLTLDDEAEDPLPPYTYTEPLTSGTYRPTDYFSNGLSLEPPAPGLPYGEALSVFDGTNPNGTYSLYVKDFERGSGGTLAEGYSLEITADCPVASPPLDKDKKKHKKKKHHKKKHKGGGGISQG